MIGNGFPPVPLAEIARPVARTVEVIPGVAYRTIGVKWWGEGAYERESIDGSQTAARTLTTVRENDLIINKIWVRHGSTAIATAAVDGCSASGEFPTFELDRTRVEPRWLHWQTKTRDFWAKCDALSRGTSGKNRIQPERFLTIPVPLPPLAEQCRIVARIEALAAKIAEAHGLRQEAIEGVNGFVTSLHLHLSSPNVVPLDEYLTLDETRDPVELGQEYPQVGVRSFGQGLFAKGAVDSSQTTYKAFNRLYEGAIVLSQVKGWEGAIAGCPASLAGMFVSPEYRTFRCIPGKAEPKYLSAVVTTPWFWTQLKDATRGAGDRRERTRPEQFLQLKMPMPCIEKQRRAITILEKLEPIRQLQTETTTELDAILPAILDRAFRGEL